VGAGPGVGGAPRRRDHQEGERPELGNGPVRMPR
jgi:hypothetical protein